MTTKTNKALPKRLASKPPFSAAISSRKQQHNKLLSLHRSLVLLCSLQGKIVLDQRFKPLSVNSKHSGVFIRVQLHVCLHYYRQQFPFTLRIVSTKRVLFYCVFHTARVYCLWNVSNREDHPMHCLAIHLAKGSLLQTTFRD